MKTKTRLKHLPGSFAMGNALTTTEMRSLSPCNGRVGRGVEGLIGIFGSALAREKLALKRLGSNWSDPFHRVARLSLLPQ